MIGAHRIVSTSDEVILCQSTLIIIAKYISQIYKANYKVLQYCLRTVEKLPEFQISYNKVPKLSWATREQMISFIVSYSVFNY